VVQIPQSIFIGCRGLAGREAFVFSHLAIGNFQLGQLDPQAFENYLAFRACFIIAISAFYLFSYLKSWHFDKISVLYVGIAITALVMDYFNAYVYLSENPLQWMTGLIALRCLAVGCLLMNALRAHRAPAMPRHLWSDHGVAAARARTTAAGKSVQGG